MGIRTSDKAARFFESEVDRLRSAGAVGAAGRLRELFDFLADRGPDAGSASQAEIAETVFGQMDGGNDDATVRVYIHRLRKRLDEFYASADPAIPRLAMPSGAYALRLTGAGAAQIAGPAPRWLRPHVLGILLAGLALLAAAFAAGRWLDPVPVAVNAMWQPIVESRRPKLIVVGDYYMFGEMDPIRPERSRLIRDFRVNTVNDLTRLQDQEPERYGAAEDVGLNYLPFSVAYGVQSVAPILASSGRPVRIIAASQLEPDMLNDFDVVYVGLFSGMALLEDITFMNSNFGVGESYDELVDSRSGKDYVSGEARNLPSAAYYNDYAYVTRFRSPGGAWVAVVAGARDTALRGVAPLIARPKLSSDLASAAERGNFEAVFQITGQKGADMSEKLQAVLPRK